MRALLVFAMLALLSGCARYEFDLVEPAELARHIGQKGEAATIVRDELEYRLEACDGHLVMEIANKTEETVELAGERSFVVDAKGQSRPLRGQAIGPRSFIRLILPPTGAMYRAGPTVGVGVSYWHHRYPWHDPWYDPCWPGPYYVVAYDEGGYHWRWEDESSVKLGLTYRRKGEALRHEFVFRRRKM
jgi:hypothetical protein